MAAIALVGVGAIGGIVAGLLHSSAQHQLTLCTRRPLPVLRVDTPDGPVEVAADNLTEPARGTPADWIFVATKAYDAKSTALWFPMLCGLETRIAILQNGVEHCERFAPLLPRGFPVERLVPVVIDCPAEKRADGWIAQRGPAILRVQDNPEGRAFAALFYGSAAEVDLTPDFRRAAWHKLCYNSAGILSALLARPSIVFHDEEIGRLAVAIVEECAAVGRAEGADLGFGLPEHILKMYRAGAPDGINSMLADRLAGKPMEVEARNGVLLRLGEKHGIPTPANRMAVALLNAMA